MGVHKSSYQWLKMTGNFTGSFKGSIFVRDKLSANQANNRTAL